MFQITSYKDVAVGFGAAIVMVALYNIRAFLYVESCDEIQRKAKAPIAPAGDNEAITIWGFQKVGAYPASSNGVCDGSPYVARIECYLRLLGKPYTKEISVDLHENPRKKLPFANVYGVMVDDSGRILAEIQKHFDIDENKGLTKEQLMNGHFIRRLLTGNLYWVRYSMNFGCTHGRKAVVDELRNEVPVSLLVPVIGAMVVKSQQANLYGQGIGRMPFEEIIEMGKADLRALNSLLGNNTYILGTKEATVFDSDTYAFLGHLFYDTTPSEMPWVQEIMKELPKLSQYVDRMRTLIFPELKAKTN